MFNPDNLKNLLDQAQKVQEDVKNAQESLQHQTFVGTAGPGEPWVTAILNGTYHAVSLEAQDPVIAAIMNAAKEAVKKGTDQPLIQILNALMGVVKDAFNKAVDGVEGFTKGELGKLMEGMNLPMDLLGNSLFGGKK